jgi:hypothetical protein
MDERPSELKPVPTNGKHDRPEEIRQEIEHTRERLDLVVDELSGRVARARQQLRPAHLWREHRAAVLGSVGAVVGLAALFIGLGVLATHKIARRPLGRMALIAEAMRKKPSAYRT